MRKLIEETAKIGFALWITFDIGSWAVYHAYSVRNYEAIGGEYILIAAMFIISYGAMNYFINTMKEVFE